MKFEDLKIGDKATESKTITDEMVKCFAQISGDNNPLHLDDSYAAKSIFGKRIVHGLFVSSFISSVIANKLPGIGSIYLNQTLNFKAPVFLNETISTEVEIIDIKLNKNIIYLKTTCTNQDGIVVIDGSAIIKKP